MTNLSSSSTAAHHHTWLQIIQAYPEELPDLLMNLSRDTANTALPLAYGLSLLAVFHQDWRLLRKARAILHRYSGQWSLDELHTSNLLRATIRFPALQLLLLKNPRNCQSDRLLLFQKSLAMWNHQLAFSSKKMEPFLKNVLCAEVTNISFKLKLDLDQPLSTQAIDGTQATLDTHHQRRMSHFLTIGAIQKANQCEFHWLMLQQTTQRTPLNLSHLTQLLRLLEESKRLKDLPMIIECKYALAQYYLQQSAERRARQIISSAIEDAKEPKSHAYRHKLEALHRQLQKPATSPTPQITPLEAKLIEFLESQPLNCLELSENLYGDKISIEAAEGRVKNLLHRLRAKFPNLLEIKDNKYHLMR